MMFLCKVGGGAWTEDGIKIDVLVYLTLRSSPPIGAPNPGEQVRLAPLRNKSQTEYQNLDAWHVNP